MERPSTSRTSKRLRNQFADKDGGVLVSRQPSVFKQIERGLLKSPHQPAIICMHQSRSHGVKYKGAGFDEGNHDVVQEDDDAECLKMTYTQLHASAVKFARGLVDREVQAGANVLCMVENGIEYALLLWAGVIARLTHSPIDPALLEPGKANELRCYLQVLKPDVVVIPSTSHIDAVERAASQLGIVLKHGIFLEQDGQQNKRRHWKSFSEVMDRGVTSESFVHNELLNTARCDDPDRISSIMFTSGTSAGRPKGCPLSVASQTHALKSQAWLINKDNCTRVLQQGHNSRAIALLHALLTWQAGGALVLPTGSSFSLGHTVDAILHHRATFVALSPALVHTIGQELLSRGAKTGDWDHVQMIQVGGDAVTKEVIEKCAALFRRARVVVNHGTKPFRAADFKAGYSHLMIYYLSPSWHEATFLEFRQLTLNDAVSEGAGSFFWPFHNKYVDSIPFFSGTISPVGVVARGARVVIWDSKRRAAALRGQPGELLVCSPSLIQGYVGGEQNDNEVFCQDRQDRRWMKTGDIALMDQHGLVYILGRSKHAINRGGLAIMPAVVESCIENFTGGQASVVAVPSPLHGYEPFAVVHSLNGIKADDIIQHVKRCLGKEHLLFGVASLAQVGLKDFPVNATHKIIKAKVEKAVREMLKSM